GNVCPEGQYCEAGSANGTYCPPGTWRNETTGKSINDCQNCTQGSYCAGYGNIAVDGDCDPGYYCPEGMSSSTPADFPCPVGHYCPSGSYEPIRCESGYYQDETTKGSCKLCISGFYCDNTIDPVVLFNSTYCPAGEF
ncbi:unnamed protein product, partial [Owenia fusiformis]